EHRSDSRGDRPANRPLTPLTTPAAPPPALPTPSFLIAQESEDLVNVSLPDFLPSTMGFSFENRELTDAIKGDPYLTNWGNFVQDATRQDQAQAYERYWAGALYWLFDSDVCMNPNSTIESCVLTIPARRWLQTQLLAMSRGMCEGMAAASLYVWDATIDPDLDNRENYLYTDIEEFLVIGEEFPIQLTVSADDIEDYHFPLKSYMAELFMLQNTDDVALDTVLSQGMTPSDILAYLIGSIANYQVDDDDKDSSFKKLAVLGIYRQDPQTGLLTDGHTLTPYAVREMPDGTFQVAVYDSNAPGRDDLYVTFNGDTWSYDPPSGDPYMGDALSPRLDLTTMGSRFLGSDEFFDCPFCARLDTSTDVFVDGNAELTVIDYRTGQSVQTASRNAQGGLGLEPPVSFNLADEKDLYLLTLAGEEERPVQDASLVTLGSGFSIGVENVSLPAGAQLLVFQTRIDGRPTIIVQSQAAQTIRLPTLFVAIEEVDANGVANSYQFELYDIQIPPDRAVFASVDLNSRVLYFGDNDGEPDSYNLYVRFISGEYATNVVSDESDAAYFDRNGFLVDVKEVPYDGSQFGVFEYGRWADNGTTESTDWTEQLPLLYGEYDDTAIVNSQQQDVGPLLSWLGFSFDDSTTTQDVAWNAPAIQPLAEGSRGRTSSQPK
ncbi:MAG: hypothetical protein D6742_03460, partial [Cyanobacteria bacterium J069]